MKKKKNIPAGISFRIYASAWVSAMRTAAKAVISKPVLPQLENIRVSISDLALRAEAGDTETWISVGRELVEGGYQGAFLVPAKFSFAPFAELGNTILTFSVQGGSSLAVEWRGGMVTIPIFEDAEWPGLPVIDEKQYSSGAVAAENLSSALAMSDYAVARDEARPILSGMLFDFLGYCSGLQVVATDAHRLVSVTIPDATSSSAFSLIVPRRSVQILKSLISVGETISVTADKNHVHFSLREDGLLTLTVRLMEGVYPNWRSIIPRDTLMEAQVPVSELTPAIERAAACTSSDGFVRMSFSPSSLALSAQDLGYQTYGEMELPCSFDGPPFDFGIRASHLADLVEKMPGKILRMRFTDASKAVLVRDAEEDEEKVHVMTIIMPVMLNK